MGPTFLSQTDFDDDEQIPLYSTSTEISKASDQSLDNGRTGFGLYRSFAHILFPEYNRNIRVPEDNWNTLTPQIDTLDHLLEVEMRINALVKSIPARTPKEHELVVDKLLGPPQRDAGLSVWEIIVYLYSNGLVGWHYPDPALEWVLENTPLESLLILLQSPLPALQQFKYNLLRQGVATGHVNFVRRLLQLNPNLLRALRSSKSESLMGDAIKAGSEEMLEVLWNATNIHAVWNKETSRLWFLKSGNLSVPVARFLTNKGIGLLGHDEAELFLDAVSCRNTDLVRFLIGIGVDINKRQRSIDVGYHCLRHAVPAGDLKLLNLLLDHKADVHAISELRYSWGTGRPDEARNYSKRFTGRGWWTQDYTATAIQAAANQGSLKMAIMLHNFGANVNDPAYGNDGKTALYAAIENMNLEMVTWLLENGADPNILGTTSSEFPRTGLVRAAEEGHLKIVEILLKYGADPDTAGAGSTEFPCTPLLAAVEENNLEMVELLLRFKADPNVPAFGYYGTTVLEAAKALGNPQIISCLIGAGALEPPKQDRVERRTMRNLLTQAIAANDLERVSYLFEEGAQIDLEPVRNDNWGYSTADAVLNEREEWRQLKSTTMLHWAVPVASDSLFELLLSQLSKSHTQMVLGISCVLHEAIEKGRMDLLNLLLDRGGDINTLTACCYLSCHADQPHSHTLLQQAVLCGNFDTVLLLLSKGADVNFRQPNAPTTLQMSMRMYQHGQVAYEILEILLDHGAEVNTLPHDTAVLYDVVKYLQYGSSESISMLRAILRLKASYHDPARASVEYIEAFVLAASFSNTEPLKVLLDYVIDINMPSNRRPDSGTALQAAASEGHINVAEFLLENKANMNASASHEYGETALQCACVEGRLDMVQLLLNHGADLHLPPNERYKMALRAAEENGHLGIVSILQSYREEALKEWNESRIDFVSAEDAVMD